MTTLDDSLDQIAGAVRDAVMATGLFETVAMHEPKSSPLDGMSAAVWFDRMIPIGSNSGLNVASALCLWTGRIYQSFMAEPYDDIDKQVSRAGAAVMGAFIGGFTLTGLIKNVDIFGANGFSLTQIMGYINQDSKIFRVATIQIPLIVNDLWTEVA
jgi:hypothetical protein